MNDSEVRFVGGLMVGDGWGGGCVIKIGYDMMVMD